MAKSSRASSKKANNQRLKRNVFGPVEAARVERLSAKLMELASQPKESKMEDAGDNVASENGTAVQDELAAKDSESSKMDVDSGSKQPTKGSKNKVEKRRIKKTSRIVFPSYKERIAGKKRK